MGAKYSSLTDSQSKSHIKVGTKKVLVSESCISSHFLTTEMKLMMIGSTL